MATQFELRAAMTIPSEDVLKIIPGFITGHVFDYTDFLGEYQIHIFIDPRRSGYTFTFDGGDEVPLMRLDWHFKPGIFEALTVDEIIAKISDHIKKQLDEYESGVKQVEPATEL